MAPGAPCGLCIPAKTVDYVFVADGTTRYHRDHIALHEIGHLLLEHEENDVGLADLAHLLAPDVDPALVRKILGRTAYSSEQEWEAEYFATLVHARAGRTTEVPTVDDPEVAEVLDRLERSWGPPSGHATSDGHRAVSPASPRPADPLTR